jgi:hypothetical protein
VDEKCNGTYDNKSYDNGQNLGDSPKMCKPNTANEKSYTWIDGIFGCMKPVLSLIGKGSLHDVRMRNEDDWIIPFELISGE